ncbi:hypothetical protein E2F48_12695 [Arthrobacter crusticola]|uniref:Uncharacterized protein n=1 Tax=Arthrobacter crusticola TaxID=2547960 RepID=A0A4R5TUE2_9MICC|nr:hypothetical protein [Arthrobacter crusticola]TDK24675.1 hypothetical protein E2F48_12695 [Arthrobacter crusticola]
MTDSASEGHIVNPAGEDESGSDPNRRGDIGDQGNDLRFAEEQQLINQQSERHGAAAGGTSKETEGSYTSTEPADTGGGYTGAQKPEQEGEYPEKDRDRLNSPDDEGEYTDRDRG